jgi:hypothetical protein
VLFERSEFHRFQPTGALSLTSEADEALIFWYFFIKKKVRTPPFLSRKKYEPLDFIRGKCFLSVNSPPTFYKHILLQVILSNKGCIQGLENLRAALVLGMDFPVNPGLG